MGVVSEVLATVFGGGRNVVAETAEVFRVNSEAQAERDAEASHAALAQFAAEFGGARQGWFDQFVDGLNRLPRPVMAFGVIGLFVSAAVDPAWFSARMVGVALVPEPLWWLLGAIVSFYFGARYQTKGMEFRRSVAETVARVAPVVPPQDQNLALDEWRANAAN